MTEVTGPPPFRAVVSLSGVSRTFGSEFPVHALRGVDLSIMPGDWLAIVGPSGSGKSTLLNVIGLLDRPTDGIYRFEDIDTDQLDDLRRAGLRGRRIGFVFQSFHLLQHRTVVDNVALAEVYIGLPRRGRRERALSALDRVGLIERAEFFPTQLSGGERQRVAIARALIGEPALLLCDEPTGNLDTRNAEAVLELFAALWADSVTIAMITHDDRVAARAHRQVRIVDGVLTETVLSAAGGGAGLR